MASEQEQGQQPSDPITVICSVNQVKTLADGGLRVVLDMPEQAIIEAAWFMDAKRQGVALEVRARAM